MTLACAAHDSMLNGPTGQLADFGLGAVLSSGGNQSSITPGLGLNDAGSSRKRTDCPLADVTHGSPI